MFDFPILATGVGEIAAVISIISAGVGAYASVASAEAQAEAEDFNAKVAANDARASADQAQFEADQRRSRTRRLLATQRASALKSGVTESGSFLNVQEDTAIQAELDALSAIYTGKIESNRNRAKAELGFQSARNTRSTGLLTAAGTGLGGASRAYSQWPTTKTGTG